MKLWITGVTGLLGRALLRLCREQGISAIGSTHQEADLTRPVSLRTWVEAHPSLTHIVNTAAYTQVDQAEREPDRAHAVNALGPEHLASLAQEKGLRLLHISTDYVFGGEARTIPYREEETPAPVNVYGATKREGEQRLFRILQSGCILRTSWLFDREGSHFVARARQLLATHTPLELPCDQVGSPTFVPDLCKAILQLLSHSGLFHFANAGAVSRYDYALAIRAFMGKSEVPIRPGTPSSLAQRPHYSALNVDKVSHALTTAPRPWKEALQECLHATTSP